MDMNKAFFQKKEQRDPKWIVIDAENQIVGRLATKIALILRGKDKAIFTHHTDGGDYVVVINAEKVAFTGNKFKDEVYSKYTGFLGGRKELTIEQMMQRHPDYPLFHAVRGMLPKNKLSRQLLKKLKIYAGANHPHKAQI